MGGLGLLHDRYGRVGDDDCNVESGSEVAQDEVVWRGRGQWWGFSTLVMGLGRD